MNRTYALGAALLVVTLLASCNLVGPRALKHGGLRYNYAVQFTTDQQRLLNIVRLRYRENPSFLEVSSVSTSYAFTNSLSVGLNITDSAKKGSYRLRVIEPALKSGYDEKPTITYQPLRGKKFVSQLLTPIPPQSILLLYYSGWSIERLFRCAVYRLNDVLNAPTASGPTPEEAPEYAKFLELTRLLHSLQKRQKIFLTSAKENGQQVVVLQVDRTATTDPEVVLMRKLLSLRPGSTRFPLLTDIRFRC